MRQRRAAQRPGELSRRSRSGPAPRPAQVARRGTTRRDHGASASTAPAVVTLGQIATIGYGTGPVSIQRVDRNRTMTIIGHGVGPLTRRRGQRRQGGDEDQLTLPAGYSWQIRGGVQQLNNSFATLGQALILSVILEYMLLVALYES